MTTIPIDRLEFDTSNGEWPEILLARPSIWVIAYKGPGDDGWMASVTVDAYGDISVLDRLEFDAGFCSEPKMVLLSNGYVAVVYRGPDTDIWIATISVDAGGNLALVNVLELEASSGNINLYPFIIHIAGTVYAVSYGLWAGCRLRTINIGATGVIGVVVGSYAYATSSLQSFILHISGDVWCIAHRHGGGSGELITVEIDSAGNITDPFIEEFTFDVGSSADPRMIHLAGTMYAVVYHANTDNKGRLFTIDIQNNGDIAAAVTATLDFYDGDAGNPNIDLFSPGIYLITYHQVTTGGPLMAITVPIGAGGGIGVATAPVELATFSYNQRQLEVYADFWLMVYCGSGTDGYIVGMGLEPAVTTQAMTGIAQGAAPGVGGTATAHGDVTDLGLPNPGGHGHCWNTTGTPTRSDAYVDNGPVLATGAFTSALTRLKPGWTYYVRAFVRSGSTYTYGNEVSFVADPTDTKMKVRVTALDRGPGNVFGPDAYNVYLHSKRCLVRAPNGTLWIAGVNNFANPNTTVYAYYSTDGGQTWTYETAVALCSARDYDSMVVLVDSDSVPIIIFTDNTNDANEGVRYVDRRGGVWGVHEMVFPTTWRGLDAVIDATDVIHVTANDGNIKYIRGVSGSWDAAEIVDPGWGLYPVIAVDSTGKPYIVYTSNTTVLVLRERNGAWGAEEDITGSTANAEYPSVAMDVEDNLHVAWIDYNGDSYVHYNKRTAGVWGALVVVFTDLISEMLRTPSVTIDIDGVVYVVYSGDRYVFDIRYKRITAGVLGAEEVIDGDTNHDDGFSYLGSALYHRYPDSGILPTNMQLSIYQQEEREADGRPDIYYVRPLVEAAPSGGNPGIVELLT